MENIKSFVKKTPDIFRRSAGFLGRWVMLREEDKAGRSIDRVGEIKKKFIAVYFKRDFILIK